MDDDCWEARMSARSKARGEDWQSSWSAQVDQHMADLERQGWAAQRDMTLGQAMVLLEVEPFACACSGGTWCCRYRFGHAFALQRAAHIVAKLLAERAGIDVEA